MASTSTTARSRKPQALDAEDAMAMRAAELAAWAQRNIRTVIIAAGVVLVLLLVFFATRLTSQRRAERAAAQWLQVQDAAQQGTAGVPRLASFANSFDGTPESAEARLAVASIYLDQNQPQNAIPEARRVADAGGPMSFQGWMLLGAAQARANQRDAAIQTYLKAADETELVFQQQEARSEAALLNEEAGKWTAAAQIYATMLADTEEGTMDRSVVELRKAEAESRAAGARR